jgi:hypothetical protein
MRTYIIELRVDYVTDEDEKNKAMTEAAKFAAKHLYTTALMIADKRQPEISISCDDFFHGVEQLDLNDDEPTE